MHRSALALSALLVSVIAGAEPSRQSLVRDVRHLDEDYVRPKFVTLTAEQAKAQTNVALLEVDDGVMVVQSVEVELPKGDNSQYAIVEFEPPAVRDARGSVAVERQNGMLNPTRNSVEHRLLVPGGDAPAKFSTVKGRVIVRVPLTVETRTIRKGDASSLAKLGATVDGPFVRFRSGLIGEASFFSDLKPMRAYDAAGKSLEREGLYADSVNGDGHEMAAFYGSPETVEIDVPGVFVTVTLDYDLTLGNRKATKVTKQLGAADTSEVQREPAESPAGNAEAIAELQRRGLSIDADQLIAAAVNGDTKIVGLLLAAGVGVNAKGESGNTALHVAVSTSEPEVVDQLLAAGADVNARDAKGLTPLFGLAFRCEETATLEKLLARGADPNIKGTSTISPLALAKSMNCTDTVAALKKAGAK